MNTLSYKTKSANKETVEHKWFVVDAEGEVVGRLSTKIAQILRGKHKPIFTPHVDTGDYIVVVNAAQLRVTGNKLQDKMYHRHTGYIGNLKSTNLATLMAHKPDEVLITAVKGMLPKNKLGAAMLKKLKVYADGDHRHEAQQPQPLEI